MIIGRNRLITLMLIVGRMLCAAADTQSQFTSLPFSFGLVLSAFKFVDSQDTTFTSESYVLTPNALDQPGMQALQAISVAEVIREPSIKTSRKGPSIIPLACLSDSVLELDLNDGLLTSRQHYSASVDSNHQFRFEEYTDSGSVPGEWLVSAKGQLEFQQTDLFYQCHSGESYKLYDAPVHSRCAPVLLDVVELVSCQ